MSLFHPLNAPQQMAVELVTAQQAGQTLDKQLSEARGTMEKYLRDYDTLFNRTQKLTEDLEHQVSLARSVSRGSSRLSGTSSTKNLEDLPFNKQNLYETRGTTIKLRINEIICWYCTDFQEQPVGLGERQDRKGNPEQGRSPSPLGARLA